MKEIEIKKQEVNKNDGNEISKQALMLVFFFYGMLLILMAVLTKENTLRFWMNSLGILVLIEVLQIIAKSVSSRNFHLFKKFINYLSFFTVEMGTIILCIILGLKFVEYINVIISFDSNSMLLITGFIANFFLYETVLWLRNYLNKRFNFQKEYTEFKKEFEDKYNLVNMLTALATILTFIILASGIEKDSSDIAIEFFFSCSIIYVLLIHYSLKNRKN